MKIEIGKFYKTRDGRKVGPVGRIENEIVYPFWVVDDRGEIQTYTEAGRWWRSSESEHDLVEEWRDAQDIPDVQEDSTSIGEKICEALNGAPVQNALAALAAMENYAEPLTWAAMATKGYEALAGILQEAHDQAASGKGKERHANARPFMQQPILEIGRMCGLGYPTGQAQKKTQEAVGMFNRGEHKRAEAELLGAINYLAAAILLIREQ